MKTSSFCGFTFGAAAAGAVGAGSPSSGSKRRSMRRRSQLDVRTASRPREAAGYDRNAAHSGDTHRTHARVHAYTHARTSKFGARAACGRCELLPKFPSETRDSLTLQEFPIENQCFRNYRKCQTNRKIKMLNFLVFLCLNF